ncbi:ATP synthase F1 subunit gamma [Runella slithyformis]|uniref:ATP synthase gamma chain n=1 Tax=Runella slithyformis (strain ATCC 29530 / DSM 19594 / LMG 11500 / NCIMB 11436 / LSU 4) TaxID=761193 RepID=A0A7U3ZHN2_RUNSL|nr:ATP synthase F1 subunit gamma [Runella slithyformis]AEI47385.1 ATP synthase gamma chain [Runella slithyformis DSM 19594]
MASLKEVRNRITSVNSTQQITKAMKMVSAAKLRRAQDAILQMRPYAKKLSEMLATVSAGTETAAESPYKQVRPVEKVLIVIVTSDRGLCGAFNTNVVKAGMALIQEKYAAQAAKGNVEIFALGKKGGEACQRRGFKVNASFMDVYSRLSFGVVKEAAESIMADFEAGKYDAVEVIFNEFKNVATQIIRTDQLLPIPDAKDELKKATTSNVNYIFEPSEEQIVTDLIPKTLKIQLYRAVLESNASEHGARMTAMDKATDNAQELIKALRLEYNRSRQAAITKEILEIVGGAEALSKG